MEHGGHGNTVRAATNVPNSARDNEKKRDYISTDVADYLVMIISQDVL